MSRRAQKLLYATRNRARLKQMKIPIDFSKPFLDIADDTDKNAVDGMVPVKGANDQPIPLAKPLSNILKAAQAGDALKYLDWAIDLAKTGKLELDESDFETLHKFVKDHQQSQVILRGQLLRAMNDAKDAAKEAARPKAA